MRKNVKLRAVIVLAVIAACVYLFYPPSEKINLGLDLRGGIHLVLQVMTQDAILAESQQTRDRIDADLRQKEIAFAESRVNEQNEIEILGVPQESQGAVEQYLKDFPRLRLPEPFQWNPGGFGHADAAGCP